MEEGPTGEALLCWREAARRLGAGLRASRGALAAWAVAALALLVQQETRLLGGAHGNHGGFALSVFGLATTALALPLLRASAADPARVTGRALACIAGVAILRVGLAAHPRTDALLIQSPSAQLLVLIVAALGAAAALLRVEARALARGAWSTSAGRTALVSGGLVLAAIVLVAAGESAQWLAITGGEASRAASSLPALALNAVAVAALLAVALGATARPALALAAVGALYAGLHVANLIKLDLLRAPLSVFDLRVVRDFLRLGVVGPEHVLLVGLAVAASGFALWRASAPALAPRGRVAYGVAGLAALALLASGHRAEGPRELLRGLGVYPRTAEPRESVVRNGLLLELLLATHALTAAPPPGYGPEAVAAALAAHPAPPPPHAPARPINLIVYFVEALTDPRALGFDCAPDPIPTFRALREAHGESWIVSPVFGGLSANAEFELISGMSMAFLPRDSCPFKEYVGRDLPALPRALAARGYRTVAIHAEPLAFYGRETIYPLLGYEQAISVADDPAAERDVAGRRPSDEAVVGRVIREAAASDDRPFFFFVGPNSTHWPWHPANRAERITVRTSLPADDRAELEAYLGAVRIADRALARLIEHFSRSSEPTAILVLGDHLPALSSAAYAAGGEVRVDWSARAGRMDLRGDDASRRAAYRVPAALWTNYRAEPRPFTISMNYVPALLLEEAGVPAEGFLGFTAALRRELPVLGRFLQGPDGVAHWLEAVPARLEPPLHDYRTVQYDLLLGDEHAARAASAAPVGAPR